MMASRVLGLVCFSIYLLLDSTFAIPLDSAPLSSFALQPTLNDTSIPSLASAHFQPTCSATLPGYHLITRPACSEGLQYLINNHPETPRKFVYQEKPYRFPPQPLPGTTCEITVFTRLPGHEAVFDFYDIYVDADAIIDKCGAKPGTRIGPLAGRVQMLEEGRWNGFWVEVYTKHEDEK